MNQAERRRFMRHVRAHRDVHRHRLAPAVAARLQSLQQRGQLQVHAGRLQQVQPQGDSLQVCWLPRGAARPTTLSVDRMINCTGADGRSRATSDSLWRSLFARGLAQVDALGLGIRTGSQGALVSRDYGVLPDLFYLGPMLRAQHWEATAVGELRMHAQRLAQRLLQSHRARGSRAVSRVLSVGNRHAASADVSATLTPT